MSVKERQLAAGRGGEGVSDKAELYDRKKALALYKSFDTLRWTHLIQQQKAGLIFPFSVLWEDPFVYLHHCCSAEGPPEDAEPRFKPEICLAAGNLPYNLAKRLL
jgi:hypothetical protein